MQRVWKSWILPSAFILTAVLVIPTLNAQSQVVISPIRTRQVRETGTVRVGNRWVRRPVLSSAAEIMFRGIQIGAGSSVTAKAPGGNIQVNQDTSARPQNETTIAINPANPSNIIGGANDYQTGDSLSGFYASFNAGTSWQGGLIFRVRWPDGSSSDGQGDPSVTFDAAGVAYHGYISFKRADGRNAIAVSRSFNGGLTWSFTDLLSASPVGLVVAETDPASEIFHDKDWIATDRTGGAHNGRVYVTWNRFDFTGGSFLRSTVELAYSDDQAGTFTLAGEVNGSDAALCEFQSDGEPAGRCDENGISQPVVLPDGRVAILFENFQNESDWTPAGDFDGQYLMTVWDPDTSTVAGPYRVGKLHDGLTNYPLNNPTDFRQTVCEANFRLNSDGNPALSSTDGKLYVVWSDNRNGSVFPFPTFVNPSAATTTSNECPSGLETNTDVFLSTSTDGGVTWSPAAKVNSSPAGDQWFPWVDVAPNGRVEVVYFDRSYDADNKLVDATVSRSTNGGVSWIHQRASSVSSDMDFAFGFGRFIGDYNGIAVTDTRAFPFWTDARNGTSAVRQSDVFIARLTRRP